MEPTGQGSKGSWSAPRLTSIEASEAEVATREGLDGPFTTS